MQPNEEDVKRKVTLKLLKDLSPDNCNANRGTDRGRSMLGSSLKKYGAGRSILIDKHGTIIAGNKTVETAQKAGLKDLLVVQTDGTKIIAVQRTDLDMRTDKRARELAIADNRVAEIDLDWNDEVLREVDVDLSQFWNDAELRKLIGQEYEEAPEPQMDRAAELQQKWGTARGQIWEIGKHRVMCGDSTSSNDMTLLMGRDRAECMWTDPPYGVSYVGKTKNKLTIQNDGAAGLEQFLLKAFSSANAHALADGAAVYVAHPAGVLQREFTEAFVGSGWHIHQTLVWVKDSMVMGHSDYHYRHEPILFGYKLGKGRRGRGGAGWYGDNSQTSIFEVPRPKASEEHPTMKPPALVGLMIGNSCPKGGLVFDPFLGSGTTAVAAEQTGRVARCCEIDPGYVAVALERLADMGLKPKLAKS